MTTALLIMLPKASNTNLMVYWVTVPISNIPLIFYPYLLYYKCAILKFTFKRIELKYSQKNAKGLSVNGFNGFRVGSE